MRKNKHLLLVVFCFFLSVNLFASALSSYNKGIKFFKKGNIEKAKKYFNIVLKKYKNSEYTKEAQLKLIECNTDYFETIVQLKHFLNKNTDYKHKDKIYHMLGNLYYLHNNFNSAIEEFSIITNKYKDSDYYFSSLYWLGNIYIYKQKFDKAYSTFNKILNSKKYNTYQPYASLRLGDIRFHQKKFYSAITNYKKTLQNFFTDDIKLESYFFLAESYFQIKEYKKAYKYYEKVLNEYNDTEFAQISKDKISYIKRKTPEIKFIHKKTRSKKDKKITKKNKTTYYVQVGNFKFLSSANNIRLFLKKEKYPVFFKKIKTKNGYSYKVWVGGYNSRKKAEEVKNQLKNKHKLDAFIVSE